MIHEREKLVMEAEKKLRLAMTEALSELTIFEELSVVNHIMSEKIGSICKYQIRFERHGDYETPGGLA